MRPWFVLAALGVSCSANDAEPSGARDSGVVDARGAWRDEPPIDPASLLVGAAPFKDVAAAAGLPATGGMCVVFEDFDGDDKPDIFLASFFGAPQAIALYLNDGAGRFTEKRLPPLAFEGENTAPGWCAAGDLDGDGKLDVVLAAFASFEAHVLRNTGGGTFADVQKLTAPAAGRVLGFSALALADLDGDGRLDLVAGTLSPAPELGPESCAPFDDGFRCESPGKRCAPAPFVFRNTGAAAPFGPPSPLTETDCGPAHVNALTIADWNEDGRPDVFASNDWGANAFYVNGPGMTFTDVLPALGTKPYNSAMGAAVEDFDRDGKLDLYVVDMGSDQLYPGTGGAALVDRAAEWGVAPPTRFHSGWGPIAEDFDSDGRLDLFIANSAFTRSYRDLAAIGGRGLPETIHPQHDLVFYGEGARRFKALGVQQTKVVEATPMFGATAVADFDGDGRLDVLESVGYPMRIQLLHNEGPRGHWLEVRLRGLPPNVDGMGATVTLHAAGAAPTKRYVQRMRGTNGSSWARLHFGLGAAAAVDRVEVRWPNGKTQTVAAPPVDALLEIAEAGS